MERLRERIRAREAAAANTPSSDCKASVSALLEAARGPSSVNALLQAASEPIEKKEQKQKQKVPPSLNEKERAHLGLILGGHGTDDSVSAENGTTPEPSVELRLWKPDTRNGNYANDDDDDKDEYRELLALNAAHNAEDPSGAGFVIGANVISEKQIYFIEFEGQRIGYVIVVPSFVHLILPDRRQLELFTSKVKETTQRILALPAKLPLVERIYVKPDFRKQGHATKALASLGDEFSLQALMIHCPVPAIQKAMKQALSMDVAAVRADAEGKPLVLYMSGIEPPTR
jgi:GNAT superfamily N-acetyltransferase